MKPGSLFHGCQRFRLTHRACYVISRGGSDRAGSHLICLCLHLFERLRRHFGILKGLSHCFIEVRLNYRTTGDPLRQLPIKTRRREDFPRGTLDRIVEYVFVLQLEGELHTLDEPDFEVFVQLVGQVSGLCLCCLDELLIVEHGLCRTAHALLPSLSSARAAMSVRSCLPAKSTRAAAA